VGVDVPLGWRHICINGLDNIDDQTKGFSDFKQGLDWMFRMVGYEDKRHIAEGPNQAW
jgi:hypothetical protein